jgi:hypothetical protein
MHTVRPDLPEHLYQTAQQLAAASGRSVAHVATFKMTIRV